MCRAAASLRRPEHGPLSIAARAADYGHVLARHALEGLAAWMQDESLDPVAEVDAAERAAVTQVLEETRDAR